MAIVDVDVATEGKKLSGLYAKLTATEEALRSAGRRIEELSEDLAQAELRGDEKAVGKARDEIGKLRLELQGLTEVELGLRKATAAQSAVVREARVPAQREQVEEALRAWMEFLPQLEAAVMGLGHLHAVAYQFGFGSERSIDPFTGLSLQWCPSIGQLEQWKAQAGKLQTMLRKNGYSV
jgi:chromosome segregation ATPase